MNAEQRRHQIKFFINKFEATREHDWCAHELNDQDGRSCALGHTGVTDVSRPTPEALRLAKLFNTDYHFGLQRVADINNGHSEKGGWGHPHETYQQPTPRQRVLAALYDLLKL